MSSRDDFERTHALAQRRFERVFPALLDVDAAPQALQACPGRAWPARAASLPSVLTFSCSALSASMPRRQVGLACALSVLTACWRVRRSSSSCGTLSCSSCRRASAVAGGFLRGGELLLQVGQPRFVGRGQRVAGRPPAVRARCVSWRDLLLDVALVGRQHLDLLLHLRHAAALLVELRPAPARSASSRSGSCCAVLFDLGGQQHRPVSSASTPCAGQRFDLGRRVVLAARPIARSARFSCSSRCSTRWRPSTTKRISASSRPTSALASYSWPCAWLTWSPAA